MPALVAPIVAFLAAGAASSSPTGWSAACARARSTAATGCGQIVSASLLSLSHGTNDAQKTMGIITLALIAHGTLQGANPEPPFWVIVSAATAIALGTYTGGWRIIRTMGSKIYKMDPAQGFAAQGGGAAVLLTAVAPRLPAVDDALDHRRRARRRRRQAPVGGPLGPGRQHRRGLGADAAGRGRRRRGDLRREPDLRHGRARAAADLGRLVVLMAAMFGKRLRRGPALDPAPAGRMIAAIDSDALLELVWAAPLAAITVTIAWGLVVYGTRAAVEARRDGRTARRGAARRGSPRSARWSSRSPSSSA